MKLSIKLLDEISFSCNNTKINIPYKKIEAIVIYLIVEKKATREFLSELFWENYDNDKARKNLRNTIYNIKKFFGNDFIITQGNNYVEINLSKIIDCDYYELLQVIDKKELSKTYKLFPNLNISESYGFESWIEKVRSNIYTQQISINKKYIDSYIDLKNYHEVVPLLKNQIILEKFEEDNYYLLMEVYNHLGKYNSGITLYKRMEKIWIEEFNIAPESRSTALYNRIKDKYVLDLDYTSDLFLASDRDLYNRLLVIKNDFLNFHTNCNVILSGERGSGRSYFTKQFIKEMNDPQAFIVSLEEEDIIDQYELSLVYYLCKKLPNNDSLLILFKQYFLNTRYDNHDNESVGPFIQLILDSLVNYSKEMPLIIVISNCNEIDISSLKLLRHLYNASESNVMYLMVSDQSINDQIRSFTKDTIFLNLAPWTYNNLMQYIKYTNIKIDNALLEGLLEKTSGNQLLIKSYLSNINKKCIFEGCKSTIEDVFFKIGVKERKLLDFISVFTNGVSFNTLRSICKCNDFELIEQIDILVESNILVVKETNYKFKYFFKQILIKNYTNCNINPIKKRQFHSLVANYYENNSNYESDYELVSKIGYHYNNSEDKIKSLKFDLLCLSFEVLSKFEYFPVISITKTELRNKYCKKDLSKRYTKLDLLFNEFNIPSSNLDYQYIKIHLLLIRTTIYVACQSNRNLKEELIRLKSLALDFNNGELLMKTYRLILFFAINECDIQLYEETLEEIRCKDIDRIDRIDIGRFYAYLAYLKNDYSKAISYYEKNISSININRNRDNSNNIMASYFYLGLIFVKSKLYNRALIKFKDALSIYLNYPINNAGVLLIYGYLMISNFELDDEKRSYTYAIKVRDLIDSVELDWKKALIYSYLFAILKESSLKDKAIKYLKNNKDMDDNKVIYSNLKLDVKKR